jgi:hypothetical protein
MDQNTTTAPASSLIQTNRITKDVARSRLPQSLDWRLQLFSLRTTKVNLLPWAARQLDIGRETRGQVRDLAAIIRERKKKPLLDWDMRHVDAFIATLTALLR